MKPITIRQLSFTGLLLFMASAITATVLPGNADKKTNKGRLILSSDAFDLTCINGAAGFCTYTQTLVHGVDANNGNGSRTSAVRDGNNTSTITNVGGLPIRTITENNGVPAHDHTSID